MAELLQEFVDSRGVTMRMDRSLGVLRGVKLIGLEHVGIASDFDGGGGIAGWRNASETLNVTTELVRRGYSQEEIRKLWGANALRVWRDVERVSTKMKQ